MKRIFSKLFGVGVIVLGLFTAVFVWKKNTESSEVNFVDELVSSVSGLREWNSALSREIVRSHRDARDVCVAVVSVESSVERINSEWLRDVEVEIVKSVRGSDLLAHNSNGEFYLLFPEAGLDEGYEAIERMKGSLPQDTIINASVAVWDHCETASELMSRSINTLQSEKKNVSSKIIVSEAPVNVAPVTVKSKIM